MCKQVKGILVLGFWLSLPTSLTAQPSRPLTSPLALFPCWATQLSINFDAWLANCLPYALALTLFVFAWAVGLASLFFAGRYFSQKTLAMIEKLNAQTRTTPQEAEWRARYRTLIDVAAWYYYLTLPALTCTLLLVVGGTLFFFLWLGRLPLKFSVLLIAGAAVVLARMLSSLFVRISLPEYGRVLKPADAPGLFQLVQEVAQTVGTRPVNEIRLLPASECAVYEEGSAREKAADKGKRILLLGAALIPGMRLNALRAVLAHEYGHFFHRDTAGGEVALGMRYRLREFLLALEGDGGTNAGLTAHVIIFYLFVFNRISFGASRLQEVLADRIAVSCYGAAAFREGLTHAIRRSLEFDTNLDQRLRTAAQYNLTVENLYGAHLHNTQTTPPELAAALTEILNQPTTPDDSHPSPAERFRLAARIPCRRPLPPDGWVWDLFADHGKLFGDMSALLQREMEKEVAAERYAMRQQRRKHR